MTIGHTPRGVGFDGTNLWVTYGTDASPPNAIAIVRASNGSNLQTLTSADLEHPDAVAFDGQRMLVGNGVGSRLTLWNAADLTQLGALNLPSAGTVNGICKRRRAILDHVFRGKTRPILKAIERCRS